MKSPAKLLAELEAALTAIRQRPVDDWCEPVYDTMDLEEAQSLIHNVRTRNERVAHRQLDVVGGPGGKVTTETICP